MKIKPVAMTCETFQMELPKLRRESEDIADIKLHPHPQMCEVCMGLLNDLELIVEEAERRFGERLSN